jgi:ParB/RepB/Spo0J family partition protein
MRRNVKRWNPERESKKRLTKSMNRSHNIEHINPKSINDDLWDARQNPAVKNDMAFHTLKQSIKTQGLLVPIHITPNLQSSKNNEYSIVDGRRRFAAMKELEYKEIPCIIITGKSPEEIAAITILQNIHRKNLNDVERCKAFAKLFEMYGYTVEQVITNCKRIHNHNNIKDVDVEFARILESTGYTANYMYQLMQLLTDIPSNVLQYAEQKDLRTNYKILLTHSKLRKHPKIQRMLVDKIKGLDFKKARLEVAQAIRDLETGALLRDGNSYIKQDSLREKVVDSLEVFKTPHQNYLEILEHTNELLRYLTGHQLAKGEYEYTSKHIQYSKDHRIEIIKSLDNRTLITFEKELQTLGEAIQSTLVLLSKEVTY